MNALREALDVVFDDAPTESEPLPMRPEEIQTPAQAVIFFNRHHCVACEAGKTLVLRKRFDNLLQRQTFDRMEMKDLHGLYSNFKVKVGTKKMETRF